MLRTVEDVKKEFDDTMRVFGNKFHICLVAVQILAWIFVLFFLDENDNVFAITLAICIAIVLYILALIFQIKCKWKSMIPLYFGMVLDLVTNCLYRDEDTKLLVVTSVLFVIVYFDELIVYISASLTFIYFVFWTVKEAYDKTLEIALWNNYTSFMMIIVLTITCIIICKKVRKVMYSEKVSEFLKYKNQEEERLANRIQEGFLNHNFPQNEIYNLDAYMKPCKNVGGDFYDYYMISKNHFVFMMADVSGKGVPASLFMANAKAVIKSHISNGRSFEKSLEMANRDVMRENKEMQFITLLICIVNLENGKMNYINAGHVKPLVINKDGNVITIDSKPDFVFGARKDTRYHSNEYMLNEGDKIFLCTDGVTERLDKDNNLYGKERLIDVLSANAKSDVNSIIPSVVKSLDKFGGEREQNDDITCLIFEYKKNMANVPIAERSFDVNVVKANDVIEYIKEILVSNSVPVKIINLIMVASDEIISNVLKYAYEGMDAIKTLDVSVQVYNNLIEIKYIDKGKYFDPLSTVNLTGTMKVSDKSKIGGLGIQLTWNIMDNVEYHRINDKNVLLIRKEF